MIIHGMRANIFNKLNRLVPVKWRWIFQHTGFKRYFANTSWMFFGQIFSLFLSFFVGAWLARYLGPNNYGNISYAVAIVGVFGFIANLGIDDLLRRDLIIHPDKHNDLLGTAFFLKLFGGFLAFILLVILSLLLPLTPTVRLIMVLYSTAFVFQAVNVIVFFFQAKVQAKNVVGAVLAATIFSSILKICLIVLGGGIIWLAVIYVLDFVWQAIGLIIIYQHSGFKIAQWRFNQKLAKKMFSGSCFLMLAAASSYIYLKIDQIMIGIFMDIKSVGIYAAAVKFVEIWYFIPGIISTSLFPAIINAKKVNFNLYIERLRGLYFLMACIAVLIAIPTTIFAGPIIKLLFGQEYLAAAIILPIYIWSGLGLFVGWIINQHFLSENHFKSIFCYNFFSMLFNILLNLIFIPRFGLTGAAWATFVSYSSGPVIVYLFRSFIFKKTYV
ncbi:MAG: flippase [Bacilli bacterium]|nr:flippase [Bacilli bacterium]